MIRSALVFTLCGVALAATLPAAQAQTPPAADPSARAIALFTSLDRNRDGFLDIGELEASELTVALERGSRGATPQGGPSRAELEALPPAQRFLRLLDRNNDRRISRSEFLSAVAAR